MHCFKNLFSILIHWTLITNLGSKPYYHVYFTDVEMEAEKG